MVYKLELTRQAERTFDSLMKSQPKMGRRVAMALEKLVDNPDLGVPLRGELKGLNKYRVGVYRIIYQIIRSKLVVTIIDIGHRKEIYR
jgi:mRNA interferase RelE/StbE